MILVAFTMLKNITNTLFILIALAYSNFAISNEPRTALQTVESFYRDYLNYNFRETPDVPPPTIKKSKSFEQAIEKHTDICRNYSTGVCGFAADGDEYLNAQEIDPLLTYENAGIKFRELENNTIEVKLNVYPSEKEHTEYYTRTIIFKMIKEDGSWVADDILYDNGDSSRDYMETENKQYLENPDPDSQMGKKKSNTNKR